MDKVNGDIKKRVINPEGVFDKMFVERCGAGIALRDAMAKIIENRPNDPISFLADYFHNISTREDGVKRAMQEILLTSHGEHAFAANIVNAYEILSADNNMKAVVGRQMTMLIDLLIESIDLPVRKLLRRKLICRDYEAIPLPVFRSLVITCITAPKYIKEGKTLFATLDFHKQGYVETATCESLLSHLSKSIQATTNLPVGDNSAIILKTAFELSPHNIGVCLSETNDKHNSKTNMNVDNFVLSLIDIFLLSVKSL